MLKTMMKPWSQNPSLKNYLEEVIQSQQPVKAHAMWQWFTFAYEGQPCAMVVWFAQQSKGAFEPEATQQLTNLLQNETMTQGIKRLFVHINSAGADVTQPFASLMALRELVLVLSDLKQNNNLSIHGAVGEGMGTYGGASLLLATVCDAIWCTGSEAMHMTG